MHILMYVHNPVVVNEEDRGIFVEQFGKSLLGQRIGVAVTDISETDVELLTFLVEERLDFEETEHADPELIKRLGTLYAKLTGGNHESIRM